MIDPELRRKIQAVLDAVQRDDSGALIAGQWVGGNGGQLSRETIRATDALRLALSRETNTPVAR